MARYIDADELLKKLPDDLPYKGSVRRVLMQAPTANVAPIADTVKKMRHELITRVGSYKDKGDAPSFGLFYQIITETTEELLKAPEKENKSEKGTPHE